MESMATEADSGVIFAVVLILWYYCVAALSRYFYWIRSMRNRSVVPTKVSALTATQGLHPRGIDSLFSHSNSVTTYVHTLAIFRIPRAQVNNFNNSQTTSVDLLRPRCEISEHSRISMQQKTKSINRS